MMRTIVTIHPDRTEGKVPEYLFGHFLEYMYDCIDPGLWAELLFSRGFESLGDSEKGLAVPWEMCGEDICCELDRKKVYGQGNSQYIRNFSKEWGGIQQKELELEAEQVYQGYLWMHSLSPVTMKVRLLTSTGELLFENSFEVMPGDWKKYGYEFTNHKVHHHAVIQYLVESGGMLWIDQTSLYPKEARCRIWPQVMERIENIHPSMMRFPGGCAADCYEWKDGIGSKDQRPVRVNQHWGGMSQNQFGTDEFLDFCRELGCEPLICVNFGSASPEEAADWVEYCNGSVQTVWGKKRAENGHPEPYGVRYWEIGNEVFGSWEIGHCDAETYAEKYLTFAKAMKEKDPSIFLLACGGDGGSYDQSWNRIVLQKAGGSLDALTLHFYAPLVNSACYNDSEVYRAVAAAPLKEEQVLKSTLQTMEETGCCVPLAITEWNGNYGEEDISGREQTMEAAVGNACRLNYFLRNSRNIHICNSSDLVNGWAGGIIRSERGYAFGTATYHLIKMYADLKPREVIRCEYNSEAYQQEPLGNVSALEQVPYVDIAACKNENGELLLFAVNRHETETVHLEIPERTVREIRYLWEEDILAKNSFEEPERISVRTVTVDTSHVELLPHGIYALIF